MKKILAMLMASAIGIGATAAPPRTVQGVPYAPKNAAPNGVATTSDYYEPDDMVADGSFTFDMIQNWSGQGENRAALVIQWNDDKEQNALVFGYRWDGTATGVDMIRTVTENNPQLFSLIQYTNVSSPTDPLGGYTICGLGWDADIDGEIGFIDTDKNETYISETGLLVHPRSYDPNKPGSTADYDYDSWKALDPDDFWGAGWYLSYWSYWVKEGESSTFSYSSWGASGRVLKNDSWDGWNFSLNMMPYNWKKFKAAPALTPDDAMTEFYIDGLYYTLGSYAGKTVKLVAPFDIDGQSAVAYTGDIAVPTTFDADGRTYTVTEIAPDAFSGAEIGEVALPSTIKKIGDNAFAGSTISKLVLKNGADVPKLGTYVFAGCPNFSQLLLPNGCKDIPEGLFMGTALTEASIPESVETIGANVFYGCPALTTASIPASVKSIGAEAFAECEAIANVSVASTFPPVCAADAFSAATYAGATLNIPMGFADAYNAADAWKQFVNKGEFAIPTNVGDYFIAGGVSYRITSASADANTVVATYHKPEGKADRTSIAAANLKGYVGDIIIPSTVKYQGKYFSVEALTDSAFYCADELLSVVLPESITELPTVAFYDCDKLTSVTLPQALTEIGESCFYYCAALNNIELPTALEKIGERAFYQAKALTHINLPAKITSIPQNCFAYTGLESINIPSHISTIGNSAFQNCKSLVEVILPENLEALPNNIFQNCSALTAIAIPTGVKTIGSSAFAGCAAFTEVVLPAEVNSINASIFSGCTALEKVTMSPEVTAIPQSAFMGCSSLHTIAYHGSTIENTPGVIRIADGTKSIAQYAFQNCAAIKDIILPDGFTTLGGREIFKRTGISRLCVPASVTSMNQNYLCGDNESVTFYICATDPPTVNRFTFAKASGKYDFPVVVPTGYAEAFKKASNWNYYTITEPIIDGLVIDNIACTDGNAAGRLSPVYQGDVPGQFACANNAVIMPGRTITLTFHADGANDIILETTTDAEGNFSVGLADVPDNIYTVEASSAFGETVLTSPTVQLLKSTSFDIEGVRTWIGEGDSRALAIFRWNDGRGVDNIAVGVRFDASAAPSYEDIVKSVIDADRRFAGDAADIRFDLNGDGTFQEEYDHFANGTCAIFAAPQFSQLFTKAEGSVGPDETVLIEYTDGAASVPEYVMYLPADEIGAWLPSLPAIALSDEAYFPILVNVGEGNKLSGISWRYTDADGNASTDVISKISVANPTKGNTLGTISFGGAVGTAHISAKPNISGAATDYCEPVAVEVTAPVRPITAIGYAYNEYDAHFDESLVPRMIIEPADASYTKIAYTSSNADVASVGTDGTVSVKRVAGDTRIEAVYAFNPEVKTAFTLHSALRVAAERFVLGDGSENINLDYLDIMALTPAIEPADADVKDFDIAISDADIASTFTVSAFNPSRRYAELITRKSGKFDLTFTAKDGRGASTTYHVTVAEPDGQAAADSWQDGTLWLNEGWFGHSNGSVNYINADGTLRYHAYASQNAGESFGASTQYAMVYGEKLYVVSKQPGDGGARFVVADARTLKKLAAFDDVLDGSDCRACVGVNLSKVYIGTTAGIAIFNPQTLEITGSVQGIEPGSKFGSQIGDMVCAGKYVFAIRQSYGTLVIDTETDAVVDVLGRDDEGTTTAFPQSVAQTADGLVWVAATSGANAKATTLYCYDPADLSLVREVAMPAHLGISCSWGSWRPTNFFGDIEGRGLWFGSGVEASIVSGNSGYYLWDTKSDLATLEPVFVFPSNLPGIDEKTMQAPYGGVRYDHRNNRLLVAATHGSSSNYRYNWLHSVDCASGQIATTTRLKDYYWFPALPVFPDKHAAEFGDIPEMFFDLKTGKEPIIAEIAVSDADNLDCNISLSLDVAEAADEGARVADVVLEGTTLTVTPLAEGSSSITLRAVSNGRVSLLNVPVTIVDTTEGISDVAAAGNIRIEGRRVSIDGMEGATFVVYDMAGRAVSAFEACSPSCSVVLTLAPGAYVLANADNTRSMKFFIK